MLCCDLRCWYELPGAADGHPIELDGGHADADGNALTVFAAGADAFVERQIVADHRYIFQSFRAVADQGRVANGGGDLAVFDEVGFAGGEDEFAAGDIDRSTAEVDRVETALDAADDVLRERRRH